MTPIKIVIWHIVKLGLLTAVISWLLNFMLALFPMGFYAINEKNIFAFAIGGCIAYYKLHGSDDIFKRNFSTEIIGKNKLRVIYLLMYGVAAFTSHCCNTWDRTFPMVVSPLLGICAGVLLVAYYYNKHDQAPVKSNQAKSNSNYGEQNQERDDISIMFTGDHVEAPQFTSHGAAHWISDERKNQLTDIKDGEPSFEGLWIGGGFFHHKEGNLVSIAPPGTGKGGALIIPNLLWKRKSYKHSFVVFDPKGTNACITARFQQKQGNKVVIIDPMDLQKANRATHGIASSHFNPLDYIEKDIFNGTSQIANLLIPDDPNGEKFWNQDARNLVQAILMHIMTDAGYIGRRNLVTFYKIMLTGDFNELFEGMILNDTLDGAVSDFASGFTNMMLKSEQTFTSVRSVANGSIKWLSNPSLQACMKKSDFDPNDLENGGITLYLCQPIQNKEGFATFSRLIVGFCLRANSKPAAKPKAWVYYLLDEFPTMGIFPEVIESLAYSREYRMRLWIFAQSLSQLDQIYKTEGTHQILGNARVLQAFGVTDQVTQEYISKRIGNKTVKVYTQSTTSGTNTSHSSAYGAGGGSSSSGRSDSTSSNEAYHAQPLIEPNAVQYDPNIITISEWGPMRLSRWQYWQKDKTAGFYLDIFKGRADKNPNIESGEDEIDEPEVQTKMGPDGEKQFTFDQ
ncbi:type IV secretory system conjugative DNA transfer family protein [Mucilaginibacter paludis]|uniref:TRAG family protein n=1 Tax=Mucilaginibacter paludis DSM 18603 TaxID=714943 RepID=H1Y5P5_9SPHI|nr:type IV secretory system conjugative DNA transfer family protein [Mucilaginibacter paludis]EHQ29821.1 TRAG family protein [Mucilaginibacter paludis DSM 18603]